MGRDNSMEETAPKKVIEKEEILTCKALNRVRSGLCLNCPAHKCNAMTCSEVELKCGSVFPVIADACCSGKENMPARKGMMNGRSVTVLRDTGCSTVVVRRSFVRDDQLTGKDEISVLINGTARHTLVAQVEVNTPFNKGQVTAVCMENPLYGVIIGTVANVIDDVEADELRTHTDQAGQEGHAVVTRAQAKKQEKPLRVTSNLGEDITREKLITLQQQDMSLSKFIKEAEKSQRDRKSEEYFTMKDGILYRYCKNFEGSEISQMVVPVKLLTFTVQVTRL